MTRNKVRARGLKEVLKSYKVKVKAGSIEKHACVTKAVIVEPAKAKDEVFLGAYKMNLGRRIGGARRVIRFRPDDHV